GLTVFSSCVEPTDTQCYRQASTKRGVGNRDNHDRSMTAKWDIAFLLARRLGLGLLTLFIVSIVIFAAVEMLPGNFAQLILGQSATPDAVAAIEHQLGLDQ